MSSSVFRVAATCLWRWLPDGLSKCVTAGYFRTRAFYKLGRNGVHSAQSLVRQTGMRIRILPALSDNYMYLITDTATGEAAVVDPVSPGTVMEAVKSEGVRLTQVLTTHHHWDHAGGNRKLLELMPGLLVYGGDDGIEGLTSKVGAGDRFNIGRLQVQCLFTPCHTAGHVCYFVTEEGGRDPAVFTGDTLFLGGCGRFFEGTADQMDVALNEILAKLPDETKVYCGHEYAEQNLAFGLHVEPQNQAIAQKLAHVQELRSANPPLPSVPSTIGQEKRINPFMRVNEPTVRQHAGGTQTSVDTMRVIRQLKDNFKPVKT